MEPWKFKWKITELLEGLTLYIVISIIMRLYNPLVGLIKSAIRAARVESWQSGAIAGGERCSKQRPVYDY